MNQIVDQFTKLSLVNRILVLVLILGAMGTVYYMVRYSSQNEALAKLKTTESKLNEKLAENQAIAKNIDKFREEVSILDEELKQALSLLPNDSDIRSLLRQMSILQKKTNISNLLFKPGNEIKKGFYAEIPINLKLKGTYHDIGQFFDKVGKLERIVNISGIEMTSPKDLDGQVVLSVDCTATTFKFVGGATVKGGKKARRKKKKKG